MNINDNDNLDISIKIEDQILFDQDNDSDTENDQINFNGEIKYSNYDVDFGIERNTILGLPEQIKAQTSYTYNKNFSLDSPELSLSGEEAVKKLVDKYSITDAKLQFGNFSLMGLELDKTIVLGAVGLNLATGIVTTQNGVFSNPLDINAVVLLLLDMNGEMKVSVSIQEEQSSYIEQGINVQKNEFEGSYGTIEENKGTNNKQNGDYWFQTTNIEAKSSAEKDQSPSSKKTLSLDGNAWDVFEYNVTNDTFKVLNKVYTTSSSAVGPIVNYQNNLRSLNPVEINKEDKEEKVNIIDEEKIESDSIKENESENNVE